jgi:hypothetical protein
MLNNLDVISSHLLQTGAAPLIPPDTASRKVDVIVGSLGGLNSVQTLTRTAPSASLASLFGTDSILGKTFRLRNTALGEVVSSVFCGQILMV